LAGTPKQSAAILAGTGTGFVFCVIMDSECRAGQCAQLESSRRGSDHCDHY